MILKPAWIVVCGALLAGAAGLRAAPTLLYDSTITRTVSLEVLGPESVASRIATWSMDDIGPKAELASRVATVVVADAAPPPDTEFVAVLSSNGDRIDLDWSGSGGWAVGDIEYYEIHFSDAPFSSVSGRPPEVVVPFATQTHSLTGLAPWQDRYLVVVAVDALGNRMETVVPRGLYVLSQQVMSRPVSYYSDALTGNADSVSRRASVVVSDTDAPPAVHGVSASPNERGTLVELDWVNYESLAVGDIESFEVYVEESLFGDVTGLTPALVLNGEATGTSLVFTEEDKDRYFAVVAVDALGRRQPLVTPSGAYVLFAQVMSRPVTWEAVDLKPNAEVNSRAANLLVSDAAPPAAINADLADTTSTAVFRGVALDWSAYGAVGQYDIDHYDVYYSTVEFTELADAAKMTLPGRVGMGTTMTEPVFPDSLGLYYVAVVPVDGAGNYETSVIPNLVQSAVGGINAPTGLTVAPDGSGLLFSWNTPPPGELPFLASYRAFLPGGQEVELPSGTTSWHSTSLPGGMVYPFDLAAINIFDDPSDLVRAPEPAAAPKKARKCHVMETSVDPACTYLDADGQMAEVMEDGAGGAWLVFDDEPAMPVTRNCPDQESVELPDTESNRAFLLEVSAAVGKAYFSATSDRLQNWEQVSPLIPGDGGQTVFLMPFDERDKAFFVIFSYGD